LPPITGTDTLLFFVFNTAHQVEFIEEYQGMTGIIKASKSLAPSDRV
jgi:hypothetical protein